MKKLFLLLTICLSSFLSALPIQDHQIDPNALKDLCQHLDISEDHVIAETQENWLRKSGKERWEMTEISKDKKNYVLNWAKNQGFLSAWKPVQKYYDKALILGANTIRMQMRLDYLINT